MEGILFFLAAGILMFLYLRNKSRQRDTDIAAIKRSGFQFETHIDFGPAVIGFDHSAKTAAFVDCTSRSFRQADCLVSNRETNWSRVPLTLPFSKIKKVSFDRDVSSSKQLFRTIHIESPISSCRDRPDSEPAVDCRHCKILIMLQTGKATLKKHEDQLRKIFAEDAGIHVEYVDPLEWQFKLAKK